MAETFDIAIVGAGITGCAIARQLARYDMSICVVEAANDIALGASKANGGLVHAGYDPAPGTVKAQVNARGCELYGKWAQELGFLFRRTGSMVLGFNDEDRAHLEKLRQNGLANGVPELSIIGPSASTSWSHARVLRRRARCGALRPVTSTRLKWPSPRWRTPLPTA